MSKLKCSRCGKRLRGVGDGWNATLSRGVVVGVLCPDCQTPDENAEAEINLATTDYGVNAFGRLVGFPKGVDHA